MLTESLPPEDGMERAHRATGIPSSGGRNQSDSIYLVTPGSRGAGKEAQKALHRRIQVAYPAEI